MKAKNGQFRYVDTAASLVGRYFGNQNDGKGGLSGAHTTVGSYTPNAWGLYDMHGNVREVALSKYRGYPGICFFGGSYKYSATECTATLRGYSSDIDYCDEQTGIRLFMSSPWDR